ncbi:TPA: hypothetical protein ACHIYF_000365, partial [Escherichia coli]
MARNAKYYNSDNSPVLACTHGRYSHAFKSEWFQHPPCTAEQAEWLIHSYRRRKRLARTVLIFTERSDQLSRATDR